MLELLYPYEKASGQKVNMCKSSVFFSTNVITNNRSDICQRLQMLEADDQTKYHGLRNIKEKQVCDFWLFKRQSEWKSPELG